MRPCAGHGTEVSAHDSYVSSISSRTSLTWQVDRYVLNLFAWIQSLLDSPAVFPPRKDQPFPKNFEANHLMRVCVCVCMCCHCDLLCDTNAHRQQEICTKIMASGSRRCLCGSSYAYTHTLTHAQQRLFRVYAHMYLSHFQKMVLSSRSNRLLLLDNLTFSSSAGCHWS